MTTGPVGRVTLVGSPGRHPHLVSEGVARKLLEAGFELAVTAAQGDTIGSGAFRAASQAGLLDWLHVYTTESPEQVENFPHGGGWLRSQGAQVHPTCHEGLWRNAPPLTGPVALLGERMRQQMFADLQQSERPGVVFWTCGLGPPARGWAEFVGQAIAADISVVLSLYFQHRGQHWHLRTDADWDRAIKQHLTRHIAIPMPGVWRRLDGGALRGMWRYTEEP